MNNFKSKAIPSMGFNQGKRRLSLSQLVAIFILSVVVAIAAVPAYFTGIWPWKNLPHIANIEQFIAIRKEGIPIPGWKTLKHQEIPYGNIGGNQWLAQLIEQPGHPPVTLFLLPQDYYRNSPEVEWLDLDGWEKWKTDSHTTLKFSIGKEENHTIEARFFIARKTSMNLMQSEASPEYQKYYLSAIKDKQISPQENEELQKRIPWYVNAGTFAIVQWYAWPEGGGKNLSEWFWTDQWAQISKKRAPWVAVSLKIPIEPLSELKDTEKFAKSLAQTVQMALEKELFQRH